MKKKIDYRTPEIDFVRFEVERGIMIGDDPGFITEHENDAPSEVDVSDIGIDIDD